MKHDLVYFDGMGEILECGIEKSDRTGVGTKSVTGMMLRYDLRDGSIPILTSKKINLHALLNELCWFIEGTGSEKRLRERGVNIWKQWATEDGHLNYVYGYQWRYWPAMISTGLQYVKDKSKFVPKSYEISGAIEVEKLRYEDEKFYVLNENVGEELIHEWYLWRNIIANDPKYIAPEWHLFENFAHDLRYLPGYHHWCKDVDSYKITGWWSNSEWISRETCAFMHITHIINLCSYPGESDKKGYIKRVKMYHDQLQECIDTIKTNPYSRRIRVSAWNVDMLDNMQLPPCHYDFTFINNPVEGGIETSLQLNMRSNDYCLGNPFNIAQYAILLRMVCHLCGTKPGDLIYVGTDVHMYLNHIDKAKEQLQREVFDSPVLRFVDRPYESIDDFGVDDFIIEGYRHQPFIKFEVAV